MASGDTLLIFHPLNNEPPSSNYATFDIRGNTHPVLDFDGSTNEQAIFSSAMPQHYTASGVTVYIHFTSDDTSGDVDWDIEFERIGEVLDIDTDSFAAANSSDNNTVDATSGKITIASVAFTDGADMDSVAAGESFRIRVTRDATSDTSTGDAQLLMLELRET